VPFRYPSTIQFGDTDASGRIFYATLFRHIDAAEHAFMRSLGLQAERPGQNDWGLPRVHAEADFFAPLTYSDDVEIEVRVERLGTTSYTLGFKVWNGTDIAATAQIVIVTISREAGRPMPIPPAFRDALAPLVGETVA